ncbi:MAG: hypothetical protein Kow0075_02790 [Salibacteraceae bacterium]
MAQLQTGRDVQIRGMVLEESTQRLFTRIPVQVILPDGSLQQVHTDKHGIWSIPAKRGEVYIVSVLIKGYIPAKDEVLTTDPEKSVFESRIELRKKVGTELTGIVFDETAFTELPGVHVDFLVPDSDQVVYSFLTDNEGVFYGEAKGFENGGRFHYRIRLSRPGYLTKSAIFDTVLREPAKIVFTDFLKQNMCMTPSTPGIDLAKVLKIDQTLFDRNETTLDSEACEQLDKMVDFLHENPNIAIEVRAHTDCMGSESYNQWLSHERASVVAKYLMERIPMPERVSFKGIGEGQPLVQCNCDQEQPLCTEEDLELNRRIEFILVSHP